MTRTRLSGPGPTTWGPSADKHAIEPGQVEARAGGGDECAQLHHPRRVLPGEDVEDGIGTGDEEDLGVGPKYCRDLLESIDRIAHSGTIDLET